MDAAHLSLMKSVNVPLKEKPRGMLVANWTSSRKCVTGMTDDTAAQLRRLCSLSCGLRYSAAIWQ